MRKSQIRTGIYAPPGKTLPYIALVITADGKQKVKTYPTRKEAVAFTERYTKTVAAKPKKKPAKRKSAVKKTPLKTKKKIKPKAHRVR